MYEELCVTPHPTLTIDGTAYDVDYFGMDDGRSEDPEDARRFLFQLGSGLMIYLYVVQAGSNQNPDHFFHTFWTKDCAVAEVDMEDHGPPSRVSGAFTLPVVFPSLEVGGPGGVIDRYAVTGLAFRAEPGAQGQELELSFALTGEGGAGRLVWSRPGGYRLETAGVRRPLGAGARFAFGT